MKILDQTVDELQDLELEDLMVVSDLVSTLSRRRQAVNSADLRTDINRARIALKDCPGRLSDDVLAEREERL